VTEKRESENEGFSEDEFETINGSIVNVVTSVLQELKKFEEHKQPIVVNNMITSLIATLYGGDQERMLNFARLIEHTMKNPDRVEIHEINTYSRHN